MSRARNTTTAPTGSVAPLGLRLLPELRDKIEAAARTNGRSLNAEVSARLQASFDEGKVLPFPVKEAIEHEMEERGGTAEEAHIRLALTAMAQGGTLLYVTLTPGTKYQQFKDFLKAGETIIPPDASIVFERKPTPP